MQRACTDRAVCSRLFVKYLLATSGFKLQHERSEPSQECVMFEMELHCEVLHVRAARETRVHSLRMRFLISD